MPNMPEKLHCSRGGFGWSAAPCASAGDAPARTSAMAAGARAENLTRIIVELPSARVPHHSAAAAAGAFVFMSTASAIDVGIGFVFSVKLKMGMMIRKKAK